MSDLHAGVAAARSGALQAALCVLLSALLVACGGGGGGGGGSSTSISVSPSSLSFTATAQSGPQTTTVHATYSGDGVVVGYPPGVPAPSWLSVFNSGSGTGRADFAVTVDPAGLAPGQYSTTLRFVTGRVNDHGDVSEITYDDLPINLAVLNLQLSPSSVNLDAVHGSTATATGSLALQVNAGQAWTAASDQPWLSVASGGTGPRNLAFTVAPAGLALGTHTGNVTVTVPGSHQVSSSVVLNVRASQLTAAPTELTFTVDTNSPDLDQTLRISDELGSADAGKALSWSVQSISAQWLGMSPTAGSSVPAVDATVALSSSKLSQMANGTYTASIVLAYTDESGEQRTLTVPVTLNLNSPLQSLGVTPGTAQRIAGATPAQFAATGTYATGYSADVTSQVDWTSSNAAVQIGNGGALAKGTGVPAAPGTATITAAMPGTAVSGTATFTVIPPLGNAYLSGIYSSGIYQYIFGDDGELQPMYGHESVSTGGVVGTTRISPSGAYAYAVSDQGIHQFTVAAGGYLLPMSPAIVPGSANTGIIAVDPSEHYLYAAAYDPASSQYSMRQYSIGSDGRLSPLTPASITGAGASAIEGLSTGGYLYTMSNPGIRSYSIASDGTLTPLGTLSSEPRALALHPSGGAAYILRQYDVLQYLVGSDGSLTPMSPASVPIGTIGSHFVVNTTGKHAYAVDSYQDKIRHFTIGADLKLTASGTDAAGVPYTPIDVALEPSGKYLYVTGNTNLLAKYTLDANGDIVGTPTYMGTAAYPRGFAVRGGR